MKAVVEEMNWRQRSNWFRAEMRIPGSIATWQERLLDHAQIFPLDIKVEWWRR